MFGSILTYTSVSFLLFANWGRSLLLLMLLLRASNSFSQQAEQIEHEVTKDDQQSDPNSNSNLSPPQQAPMPEQQGSAVATQDDPNQSEALPSPPAAPVTATVAGPATDLAPAQPLPESNRAATLPVVSDANAPQLLQAQAQWPAGSIAQQLDKDTTLIPFGKGALFIPSMVNPLDEPTIAIYSNEIKIAEGKAGTRIPLAPDQYDVYFGSGTQQRRLHANVTIKEDQLTVLPIYWSGLTIHVMDNRFNSLRAPYELFRMTDLEYIGLGFGSDEQAGEPLSTWIVPAGLYKIVRLGQSYRARIDFGTVRLEPGKHTHYLLVQDPNSGSFQGAGEIRIEDIFHPGNNQWGSLVVGGNVAFNARQGGVGFSNGQTYALQGFLDGKVRVDIADAPVTFRLQLEQGHTRLPSTIWQKNQDRLQLDMLYVYPFSTRVGPYIRARFMSNILPTNVPFDRSKTVLIEDKNNSLLFSQSDQNQLRLSGSFANNEIKEGIGFNLRLLKNTIIETTLRCGFGAIQNIYVDSLQELQQTNTSARYQRIPSSFPFGPEITAIALIRLGGWVILNAVVDTLLPLRQQSLTLSIESGATLKLNQFASFNYVFRLNQGPSLLKTAIEHNVFLRLHVELQ